MKRSVTRWALAVSMLLCLAALGAQNARDSAPLGLPPPPIPANNPMTDAKIELGDKLFHDERFSTTGDVSCSTCHDAEKVFTDSPLSVSEGIDDLTGTRNAPTVVNSAYFETMFWDGRSPDLEDQALHPFTNPVEMGLKDHQPILDICRSDSEYVAAFRDVFNKSGNEITMTQVTKAIAAFERTKISGDSPFDRYYFAGETGALTDTEVRGLDLFVGRGRCVSCHLIEQTTALFTDNRFHNIGVGINDIQQDIPELAGEFIRAEATLSEVDVQVLTDKRTSELGRLAVTRDFDDIGSFKTATLRNIAVTAPYMHDGSLATLREVVEHYNNGGITNEGDPVNDFLSGGIRPLDLTETEIDDLVAFMEALTSPEFADLAEGGANDE